MEFKLVRLPLGKTWLYTYEHRLKGYFRFHFHFWETLVPRCSRSWSPSGLVFCPACESWIARLQHSGFLPPTHFSPLTRQVRPVFKFNPVALHAFLNSCCIFMSMDLYLTVQYIISRRVVQHNRKHAGRPYRSGLQQQRSVTLPADDLYFIWP